MAPWCAGANRKQMPASSRALSWRSGPASMATPSSDRTSAAPERDESARLPCLATFRPPPAATNPTAVEMLSVCWPSPPVPQTSIVGKGGSIWTAARRIARAHAVISPRVSPRIRMAVSAAPTWAGVGSPRRQAAKNSPASSSDSVPPSARRDRRGLKVADMGAFRSDSGGQTWARRFTPAWSRKLASSSWPHSVAMDSGWNCTPWIGRVRC